MAKLSAQDIFDAGLDDWRLLAQALHARYRTGSFTKGLAFVTAITAAAEEANHHPDVTLTYPHVDLKLVSHDVGHLTERDVALARRITQIAAEHGIAAEPSALSVFELALDTGDLAALGPFWAVLLTGSADSLHGGDVVDPGGRVPLLWFQPSNDDPELEGDSASAGAGAGEVAASPLPQRFHVDLWVPHDVADERIAAAIAAGGTLVSDEHAPSFTVLADPDGNQTCVCTALESPHD